MAFVVNSHSMYIVYSIFACLCLTKARDVNDISEIPSDANLPGSILTGKC